MTFTRVFNKTKCLKLLDHFSAAFLTRSGVITKILMYYSIFFLMLREVPICEERDFLLV